MGQSRAQPVEMSEQSEPREGGGEWFRTRWSTTSKQPPDLRKIVRALEKKAGGADVACFTSRPELRAVFGRVNQAEYSRGPADDLVRFFLNHGVVLRHANVAGGDYLVDINTLTAVYQACEAGREFPLLTKQQKLARLLELTGEDEPDETSDFDEKSEEEVLRDEAAVEPEEGEEKQVTLGSVFDFLPDGHYDIIAFPVLKDQQEMNALNDQEIDAYLRTVASAQAALATTLTQLEHLKQRRDEEKERRLRDLRGKLEAHDRQIAQRRADAEREAAAAAETARLALEAQERADRARRDAELAEHDPELIRLQRELARLEGRQA